MFDYKVKQLTYDIYGVKIGGLPGVIPTVMVGSMFHKGDVSVSSHTKGIFDKGVAETHIRKAELMREKTGLSFMIDMVSENLIAASRYLNFLVETSDAPILLDVVDEGEQVKTLRFVEDSGLLDRVILNSITPHTGEQVYEVVLEMGVKSAILLTYSSKHVLSPNKEPILKKLVKKARLSGIENILVDPGVLDIPTLGIMALAVNRIKDKYGYPCGCGAHNAVSSWRNLDEKYSPNSQMIVKGVINALPTAVGADFVLFGPISNAENFFPGVAMIDAAYSQIMIEKKIKPGKSHPRYRIGRRSGNSQN